MGGRCSIDGTGMCIFLESESAALPLLVKASPPAQAVRRRVRAKSCVIEEGATWKAVSVGGRSQLVASEKTLFAG